MLRRKKSRVITIDNEQYRWLSSGNDAGVFVWIEQKKTPAQKLFSSFSYNYKAITPALVRKLILYALSQGYTPREKGKDFYLPQNSVVIK